MATIDRFHASFRQKHLSRPIAISQTGPASSDTARSTRSSRHAASSSSSTLSACPPSSLSPAPPLRDGDDAARYTRRYASRLTMGLSRLRDVLEEQGGSSRSSRVIQGTDNGLQALTDGSSGFAVGVFGPATHQTRPGVFGPATHQTRPLHVTWHRVSEPGQAEPAQQGVALVWRNRHGGSELVVHAFVVYHDHGNHGKRRCHDVFTTLGLEVEPAEERLRAIAERLDGGFFQLSPQHLAILLHYYILESPLSDALLELASRAVKAWEASEGRAAYTARYLEQGGGMELDYPRVDLATGTCGICAASSASGASSGFPASSLSSSSALSSVPSTSSSLSSSPLPSPSPSPAPLPMAAGLASFCDHLLAAELTSHVGEPLNFVQPIRFAGTGGDGMPLADKDLPPFPLVSPLDDPLLCRGVPIFKSHAAGEMTFEVFVRGVMPWLQKSGVIKIRSLRDPADYLGAVTVGDFIAHCYPNPVKRKKASKGEKAKAGKTKKKAGGKGPKDDKADKGENEEKEDEGLVVKIPQLELKTMDDPNQDGMFQLGQLGNYESTTLLHHIRKNTNQAINGSTLLRDLTLPATKEQIRTALQPTANGAKSYMREELPKKPLETLLSNDDFNLHGLPDLLSKAVDRDGINYPMLYVGSVGSVAALHREDEYLGSLLRHHAGLPKLWLAIPPSGLDHLETEVLQTLSALGEPCHDRLHHKDLLPTAQWLRKRGVPFVSVLQSAGDTLMTHYLGYHTVVNLGFSLAKAVNWAMPLWCPFSLTSLWCYCKRDSGREMEHPLSKVADPNNEPRVRDAPCLSKLPGWHLCKRGRDAGEDMDRRLGRKKQRQV